MRAEHKMRDEKFYPYGVAYYKPPTPLSKHWAKDLENISKSGFNTIRVNAFWSWIEPVEGEFDFTELDQLCHLAQKNNLRILLTTYMVSTPEWMFEKYPESRFVSANGIAIDSQAFPDVPCGGWPGLCFDSPQVREKGAIFLEKITRHFRNNPVILAFDVVHEPVEEPTQMYYVDSPKDRLFCYCSYTIKKFRVWLKEKYGSLEGLKQAWARKFSRWEQVSPPKNFGIYADWLDWRTFSIEALAEELTWRAKTVKKCDPDRFTVTHAPPQIISHPFARATYDFKLAKAVDVYGASMYHVDNPCLTAAQCDLSRSASRAGVFWVGEMSGGSGPEFLYIGEDKEKTPPWAFPICPVKIVKHSWETVAHGAKGLIYWDWRPEIFGGETAALGFTDREGNLTERVKAASRVSRVIRENKKLFVESSPLKSEVAILYNIDSFLQEGYISLFKSLGKEKKDIDSLLGAYKLFWQENIPVDFVSKEHVLAGDLKEYKLLVMPYPINISRSLGEKIKDFVKKGGTLFSEALCGFFTDGGWGSERTPGAGLDEIFCCKVTSYKMTRECKITMESRCSEFAALSCKDPIIGSFIQEFLEVKDRGEVLGVFEDESPGMVLGKYGSGRTIYTGTLLTMRQTKAEDTALKEFVNQLLSLSGIKKRVNITKVGLHAHVEARVLENKEQYLLFVINHEPLALSPQVSVEFSPIQYCVRDLIRREQISYNQDDNVIKIDLSLNSYEVKVLEITSGIVLTGGFNAENA